MGHFHLTNLLLPRIKSTQGRIVNVSSVGHTFVSGFDWSSSPPNHARAFAYNPALAYGASKLANILHVRSLQMKLHGTGASAYAVAPGAVATALWRWVPWWLAPLFDAAKFLFFKVQNTLVGRLVTDVLLAICCLSVMVTHAHLPLFSCMLTDSCPGSTLHPLLLPAP